MRTDFEPGVPASEPGGRVPTLTEALAFVGASVALFALIFGVFASVMSLSREAREKVANRSMRVAPYDTQFAGAQRNVRLASEPQPLR